MNITRFYNEFGNSNRQSPLLQLPLELLSKIISCTSVGTTLDLQLTCKAMHEAVNTVPRNELKQLETINISLNDKLPEAIFKVSPYRMRKLAQSRDTSSLRLAKLALETDVKTLRDVAKNSNTPQASLHRLSTHTDEEVRRRVICNRATSAQTRLERINDPQESSTIRTYADYIHSSKLYETPISTE